MIILSIFYPSSFLGYYQLRCSVARPPPEEKNCLRLSLVRKVSEVLPQMQPSSCFMKYQGEIGAQVLLQPCLQQAALWPAEAHLQDFVGKECFSDNGALTP